MRSKISLTCLVLLVAVTGCGHTSPMEPQWPPERPVYVEPPHVDQETVDEIIRRVKFYEFWTWIKFWDHDILWGGLEAAYAQSVDSGDDYGAYSAIVYMGATGMVEFMPTLVSALDRYPEAVCSSLGYMPSDYAVYVLIRCLDDEDIHMRERIVLSLGRSPAYSQFPNARLYALQALNDRLAVEPVRLVRDGITRAIKRVLAQIEV